MGKKGGGGNPADAARVQGEMNRETARDVTYADRPDQYNPWGSLRWTTEKAIDPATGEEVTKWKQIQDLSPDAQRLYDTNLGILTGRSNLAGGMMGRISDEMGGAPDWAQFGDVIGLDYDPTQMRQRAEDAVYQKQTSRLDPQFASQEQDLEIKLRNQGLMPGDAAYDSQMQNLAQQKADAYEQARLGSIGAGKDEAAQLWQQQMGGTELANALRNQQIQEYLGKRGFSLGEMERLQQGQGPADLVKIGTGG